MRGPIAIIVIVSGGFSARILKISRYDSVLDDVKSEAGDSGVSFEVLAAVEDNNVSGGGRSKKCLQFSSGLL